MTLKIPCGNISQALAELQPGESLLIPCNGKTIQVTHSSITSMLKKRKLIMAEFIQRKTLLIRDENSLPVPLILVSRHTVREAPSAA
ncbi:MULTISPECIES: hypothetical protein [Pseudomonas syringae group]|uniref:Uncharacterized protein n=2 Tax=Pseudomonas syringae group TaxID=136849 RepID=A0A3M3J8Z7_9PSED|nr:MULTISPECIES: hypothetical protein [Pseudomonas syringae group]RMN07294.1 hypothetical protein ALQ65_200168 [Pseudomonas syringae pv. coriandricola]RMR16841.1 hypothetical protein ALP90_200072 [Pseudomonas amygdali pv. ulmi]RMU52063.1 hypothetical protein ALP27_01220 [Pseudomonas savastanoi pv. glycinea]